MRQSSKMKQQHSEPLSAWKYLIEFGGIELNGRDNGLDISIKNILDPKADNIEEALESAQIEDFIGAFFESLQPYIEMFNDILNFFKKSKATKGAKSWTLKIGDIDLNLDHFKEAIINWENSTESSVSVPVLEGSDLWQLKKLLESTFNSNSHIDNVPNDVKSWLKEFEYHGRYLPFPESLNSKKTPSDYSELSSIGEYFLSQLLELGFSYRDVLKSGKHLKEDSYSKDDLNILTIRQAETDKWLSSFIKAYSAFTYGLEEGEDKILIKNKVLDFLSQFPKRRYKIKSQIGNLENFLSLPIWEKRYDLYAVWIGTEIITALEKIGHDIEIHDEDGKLLFAFKETILATIHSSTAPFKLISEKRIPLANPSGKGRKKAVQPDYGLWTDINGKENCKLTIEVKHYKQSSKAKFKAALEDYAQALPDSDVYLVNHGSVGKVLDSISQAYKHRCFAVGKLQVINKNQRDTFHKAVQDCVGQPIKKWPYEDSLSPLNEEICFLFDVSGSMSPVLSSFELQNTIISLFQEFSPEKFYAADSKMIDDFPPDEQGFKKLIALNGGRTDLSTSVKELFSKYSTILCFTDNEGERSLKNFIVENINSSIDNVHSLKILKIKTELK